ncbi:MAG: hypothetical protein ACI4O7_09640 [Aristaeellaceae bacterium]
MKTRIWCILAAAMLLAVSVTACAEQLPSPTQPTAMIVEIDDSLSMTLLPESEAIQSMLEKAEQAERIADLFGEEAMLQAAALLPEGFDADTLMLAELLDVTLDADTIAAEGDAVVITLEFPVDYADDAVLLAMFGLAPAEDPEAYVWTPVPTAVVEGKVVLTVPRDLLVQMAASSNVLLALLQNRP